MSRLKTIEWIDTHARIVDQTKLPVELVYKNISTIEGMYEAIQTLRIRGAPAIGIAAAFGLYLGIRDFPQDGEKGRFLSLVEEQAGYLAKARPTAVNLFWGLDRMKRKAQSLIKDHHIKKIRESLLDEAQIILEEDNTACKNIGNLGFEVLKKYNAILTHCNAGGLATAGYGTALAPLYIGKERGKLFKIYADETRPLLQGARITAFELQQADIPVTLICDGMAAFVMAQKKIDAVIVGADRIAKNGDTVNKIGTYSVALCARAHAIPFYVAAPLSTFDMQRKSGADIPIEERNGAEIIFSFGTQTGPSGVHVYNPAFDVTPHELITAIITDKGVLYPPFTDSIKKVVSEEEKGW